MYAYYCLHKFHWEPSKFVNLPEREKMFVVAAIDYRVKVEKEQEKKLEQESKFRR